VGERHQGLGVEHEPRLLERLAHGRPGRARPAATVRGLQLAAGEDPHAAERLAGVLAQHERLDAVPEVAQQDHRRRLDDLAGGRPHGVVHGRHDATTGRRAHLRTWDRVGRDPAR
jgi:hypothetical protein